MSNIELLTNLPEDILCAFYMQDPNDPEFLNYLEQLKSDNPDAFRDMQLAIVSRLGSALTVAFLNTFPNMVAPEVSTIFGNIQSYVEKHMTYRHYTELQQHAILEL